MKCNIYIYLNVIIINVIDKLLNQVKLLQTIHQKPIKRIAQRSNISRDIFREEEIEEKNIKEIKDEEKCSW